MSDYVIAALVRRASSCADTCCFARTPAPAATLQIARRVLIRLSHKPRNYTTLLALRKYSFAYQRSYNFAYVNAIYKSKAAFPPRCDIYYNNIIVVLC